MTFKGVEGMTGINDLPPLKVLLCTYLQYMLLGTDLQYICSQAQTFRSYMFLGTELQ